MNMATHFEVKGPAAMHCEALLAKQTPARDPMDGFGIFAAKLSARLAPHLKVFLGEVPEPELQPAQTIAHKTLTEDIPAHYACSTIGGGARRSD